MWRHQGVTADKRSDASRVLLLIRGAAKKPAKKLPPKSLDKDTLKSTHVDVASGGHFVAKALKTDWKACGYYLAHSLENCP
jgi:hypothetical protein